MKTPDRIERELLSAYREGERMPAAVRTAAWVRLQTALHAEALHDELAERAADGSTDESAPARHESTRRSRWGVLLLAAAAILVLIAGLRGRADRASEERDSQAVHAAPEPLPQAPDVRGTQPPAPAPTVAPPSEPAEPAEVAEPAPPTPRAPARAVDAAPDADAGSGLDAELSLLRSARAALAASDGAGALKLLAEHERRFLAGHLAEERMLLRVQALCAVDRREEARAAAARFAAQRPGSPHTATIAAICRD